MNVRAACVSIMLAFHQPLDVLWGLDLQDLSDLADDAREVLRVRGRRRLKNG